MLWTVLVFVAKKALLHEIISVATFFGTIGLATISKTFAKIVILSIVIFATLFCGSIIGTFFYAIAQMFMLAFTGDDMSGYLPYVLFNVGGIVVFTHMAMMRTNSLLLAVIRSVTGI